MAMGHLTFALLCFVYLCNWVRWDMSNKAPGVRSTGGFFVVAFAGLVIVKREREREPLG